MKVVSENPVEVESSKGTHYYLHKRGRLMYFSKKQSGAASGIPSGMELTESRTGLPMMKKK